MHAFLLGLERVGASTASIVSCFEPVVTVSLAMLLYSAWNARGLGGALKLVEVRPGESSPVHELPEREFRDAPLPAPAFEGDTAVIELQKLLLDVARHPIS